MGLGHSPRIVTDGLVLALDAGNPKNYNAGISTNWMDKVGGNNGTLINGTYHNDGPFVGAGYVEFDGTGDTLTLANNADHQFGSSDYTIESWVYLNNLSTVQGLFGRYNTSSARELYITLNTDGSITHRTSSDGTSFSTHTSSTGLLTANTWHHVAISKSGTNSYIAVDGVVGSGTVDSTLHTASQTTYIGDAVAGSNFLNGNLSNYRILKGTALYTSNFTPPTAPLTAVTNTTLLTCQGNTITDASSSSHTITANGDAAARLGFPASAFVFDGTDDYVIASANPSLNFETGDFTVECWVNISAANTFGCIFSTEINDQETQPNTFVLRISDSFVVTVGTYGVSLISSTAISANTWTHIVATRIGTTISLYVDSILQGTVTNSTNFIAGGFTSGLLPRSTSNTRITGRISNIRVLKGKGLTASEVQQNFNAIRGRYGI